MLVSVRAQTILAEFAKYQGLRSLSFNADNLIPIKLKGGPEIAIGYSPANDSLFVYGVVDRAPGKDFDPWPAFERNTALVDRRTRLLLHKEGPLVLSADAYVVTLDLNGLIAMLDRFVEDLQAEIAARGGQGAPAMPASLSLSDFSGEMVMIRL